MHGLTRWLSAVAVGLAIAVCLGFGTERATGGEPGRGGVQPESGGVQAVGKSVVMTFEAADGTPLEGKLTLPKEAEGPVPVVFYLHGAGPRTYDNPFGYLDDDGERRVGFYLDYHAAELAERGIGFFRMSKRGCSALPESPWVRLDRGVFSKATLSVMLEDYAAGLAALRGRDEVDAGRIVLLGSSEGTRLAPRLAKQSPEGIVGIAMVGYAADNARDTVVWQLTKGPWRNVEKMVPAARGGRLTREAYDAAAEGEDGAALKQSLPFEPLDADGDGVLTAEELEAAVKPRLDAILKAVEERNDELLWRGLMNLSSAYLLEWWEAEPNSEALLELNLPLAIFHGELDGTCRAEGVRETEAAFRKAGKGNLTVRVYPEGDHDLGWNWRDARDGKVEAYRDVYGWIAERVGR